MCSVAATGKPIVNIKNYTDALRSTGYKNAESAVAELIDNSLEAKAKDVLVIVHSGVGRSGRRVVEEVAVLDNGIGMDKETLHLSLVIGDGTRRARKGMGRFGVGLPQASMAICPRVEVYSWQHSLDEALFTYLDITEIKAGNQVNISTPEKKDIPENYKKYFKFKDNEKIIDCTKSGTLVVWKNCDRLNRKTVGPLFERFAFILGRKFRYWITEGKSIIRLIAVGDEHQDRIIKPNDPLLLMSDNIVLGNPDSPNVPSSEGEPVFELFHDDEFLGEQLLNVKYFDEEGKEKISKVTIRFSIAKEIYHDAGGESKLGQHLRKLVGVSIVRAGREIDFGLFGFFDIVNEPQHRFWGCEILFSPELDEIFGVSNNKQQVQLEFIEDDIPNVEHVESVYNSLYKIIHPTIRNLYKKLKERKKGSRTRGKATEPEQTVNAAEEGNKMPTFSSTSREELTEYGAYEKAREELIKDGNPTPTKEEIEILLQNKVNIRYRDLGTNTFIDVYKNAGLCVLTINTGSLFYQKLYSELEAQYGENVKKAFDLMLMAFARAEDESYMDQRLREAFADVRDLWGTKIRKYLQMDYET